MKLLTGPGVHVENENLIVPEVVFKRYLNLGISEVFEWQASCLSIPGVLDGQRNLLYSAPTSAGKTFVAEILVIKHVLETKSKAIIILPFVSVSREKMVHLQKLLTGLGVRVGGFMGGQSPVGGLSAVQVAVCTIEKANSMVNRLIEEGRLDELGLVVVDELHLIGDSHRGYLLELLLTKLLVHSCRVRSSHSMSHTEASESRLIEESCSEKMDHARQSRVVNGIQLVGMSATLPNLDVLAKWMHAVYYSTTFRPVPLTELVVSRDPKDGTCHAFQVKETGTPHQLRTSKGTCSEHVVPVSSPVLDASLAVESRLHANDEDGVFCLCLDTLLSRHGVLVFCPTKQWCEQLAENMAKQIFRLTQSHFAGVERGDVITKIDAVATDTDPTISDLGPRLAARLDRAKLMTLVEQLRRCPAGLDAGLSRCLGYSVAFHHAGLTIEEREIVENGFRAGTVRILVATSTLSSGVNLPARRVIIRTPLFLGRILDYLSYKQMAGRAGRKGIDSSGQSILLCKPQDLPRVRQLIGGGMSPVQSCLINTQAGSLESSLKRALLEVIANGFVETVADAHLYLSNTLMATTLPSEDIICSQSPVSTTTTVVNNNRRRRRSLRLSQTRQRSSPTVNHVSSSPSPYSQHTEQRFMKHVYPLLLSCLSNLSSHELIRIDETVCTGPDCSICCAVASTMDLPSVVRSPKIRSSIVVGHCSRLSPTALGRAVLSSSLGPVQGLMVFEELDKARRSVALDTELHLLYLLTPVYLDVGANMDWLRYLEHYQHLSTADRRVADLVGIEERFITRCAAGASASSRQGTASLLVRVALHRRFYTALTLYRLVCEDGLAVVAKSFGVNRGLLQSLQQQAATYAGMLTIFCNRLGWVHMERLLANYQSRLLFGVTEDLLDLIRLLPLVNARRARALHEHGYTSVAALASANEKDVARVLQRAVPFERGESSVTEQDVLRRRTIILDDGTCVNEEEAAPLIVTRAKHILHNDLALVYGTDVLIVPKPESPQLLVSDHDSSKRESLQHTTISVAESNLPIRELSTPPVSRRRPLTDLNESVTSPKRLKGSPGSHASQPEQEKQEELEETPSKLNVSEQHQEQLPEEGASITYHSPEASKSTPQIENSVELPCNSFTTPQSGLAHIESDVEETFVLTTQLAAICDLGPVQHSNEPSSDLTSDVIDTNDSSDCSTSLRTTQFGSVTQTNWDMDMNDTLTFSMLDTAMESSWTSKSEKRASKPLIPSPLTSRMESAHPNIDRVDSKAQLEKSPCPTELSRSDIMAQSPEMGLPSSNSYSTAAVGDYQSSDAPFVVVHVTKTEILWQTFLTDLSEWLDTSDTSAYSVAFQPCWVAHSTLQSDGDLDTDLTWTSGPAGSVAVGGGLEKRTSGSAMHLRLAGLTMASSRMRADTVFWIDFLDKPPALSTSVLLENLRSLLNRMIQLGLVFVVWDAKWWSRLCRDLLGLVDTDNHCIGDALFDPGTAGWLRDPDGGRPSLSSEVRRLPRSLVPDWLDSSSINAIAEPPSQASDWSKLSPLQPTDDDVCPPCHTDASERLSSLADFVNFTSIQCRLLALWTEKDAVGLLSSPTGVLRQLELPCQVLLGRMESTGFVFNYRQLVDAHDALVSHSSRLERVAHCLAGQPFRLDSPKEIATALFRWLRLPQLTDPADSWKSRSRGSSNQSHLALLSGRRGGVSLPRATNATLNRISGLHPLPRLLIEWRHVHGVLEKSLTGLVFACDAWHESVVEAEKLTSRTQDEARISPTYDVHTATGRIISSLPNIQSVPKDIRIDYPAIHTRRAPCARDVCMQGADRSNTIKSASEQSTSGPWPQMLANVLNDELPKELVIIRPREAFGCAPNSLLISADFCQLELRLLAHFSRDEHLLQLLAIRDSVDGKNVSGLPPPPEEDAFRKLAARWLHLSSPQVVTDTQRQQAKQLCYALVYGMGAKGLASQLDITEVAAERLVDSFLRAYPGVQRFITESKQTAHRSGSVTTLRGRVRLLPALANTATEEESNALDSTHRSHVERVRQFFAVAKADRQAVNSMIQGSAAEISKQAMLAVDTELRATNHSRQCQLILHEHDELVYEICPASAAPKLGARIRSVMSQVAFTFGLTVPLPVKLRVGSNWAQLTEVFWI